MEKNEKINLISISQNKINEKNLDNKELKSEKSNQTEKKRYYIFDNFKGLLIFMVVFAHFLIKYSNTHQNSLIRTIVIFIYFFHMQAFTFISGFFSTKNSIKIENALKLLILYYVFNYSAILILYFYNNTKINFLYPSYSYWYILSLFYWRILVKYLNNIPFMLLISIIISLLEGYWDCFSNVLSIYRTIVFFHYYLAGYKLSKMNILNKILFYKKSIMNHFIFFIIFCFYSYLVCLYIYKNEITNDIILMLTYNKTNSIKERIITMIISYIFIILIFLLLPNNKIIFINKWGKNSLYIYLFHRIFTIIAHSELFSKKEYSKNIIEYSIIFTLIILFFFGSDFLLKFLNSLLNKVHQNLIEFNFKGKVISNIFCLYFIFLLLLKPINIYIVKNTKKDIQYRQNLRESLINSVTITYIGDLILLKDGEISEYSNKTEKQDFNDIFQFTSKYFHSSDLSIGIYGGLSAENNTSYSTSIYNDRIPVFLNFSDELAEAVSKSGINLLLTANNNLLDKKIEEVLRTLDSLDKYNISHVGSYRNFDEKKKNKIFITNIKNVKIVILSYTSIINNFHSDLKYEKYKHLSNIIIKENNKYYEQVYKDVENDFYRAKELSPDIIIVLVHMGNEFLHNETSFQDKWNEIFSNLGADIIFEDNPHAVQPIQYIGKTFVINSPGNIANSYINLNGNFTAIIRIYISNQSKKVICVSAIPMYIKKLKTKFFSPISIYDLIYNNSIYLKGKEWKRVNEIQRMSTKSLVGKEFGINETKNEYFFINNSFYDLPNFSRDFCNKLNKYSAHEIYKYINNSNSITFIGDDITEGTKNGHHPWYLPMLKCFKKKKIINISKGSYTTKLIYNKYKKKISNSLSDLYIIALGTNDIRYRDSSFCSMNPEEYIYIINNIVNLTKNHNSNIIFIAPWLSLPDDYIAKLKHFDKKKLLKEYSLKLKFYAENNNYVYIDPNYYLEKIILTNKETYMIDSFNPNNPLGIELYCEGVFMN